MTANGDTRADRLEATVADGDLDALVVTNLVNVRYLSGFTGTNAVCVVGEGLREFWTDFRYVGQADRQVRGFRAARGRHDLLGEVCARLAEAGAHRVGFEDHDLTVRRHARLRDLLDDEIELVAAGQLVEDLRAVKDIAERRAIRAASDLATDVLEGLAERGFAGRTEREVARMLDDEMRLRGAEPAFPTIVAAGANGALPHATPGDQAIEPGVLVVVDMGAQLEGYCSDQTRTLASGPVSERAAEVYGTVLGAQQQSLDAIHAGAGCREVDAVAREAIADAGHGDHFGHGLGHGVGLEVHEAPRLTPAAEEEESLRAGSVVTVEPGVYLPGELGVRIEDLVVVGDDGPDILTTFPKALTEAG